MWNITFTSQRGNGKRDIAITRWAYIRKVIKLKESVSQTPISNEHVYSGKGKKILFEHLGKTCYIKRAWGMKNAE